MLRMHPVAPTEGAAGIFLRWGRRALLISASLVLGVLLYQFAKNWIPFHVRGPLELATPLLFALLAVIFEVGPGRWGRRCLALWVGAMPVGWVLLVVFQLWFVQPLSVGAVILAPPRLETGTCPCAPEDSDRHCVQASTVATESLALCWDRGAMERNRWLWALAYLVSVGGLPAFVGLLWTGSRGPAGRRGRGRSRRRSSPQGTGHGRPAPADRLFLSYAREDEAFAARLAHDLESQGIEVWWDQEGIGAGDSLPATIETAIAGSAWFGLVLSPDALASRWVRAEWELARTLEIEGQMVILPLLVRECEVPLGLRPKAWAEFHESYEEGLELLLRTLTAEDPPPAAAR